MVALGLAGARECLRPFIAAPELDATFEATGRAADLIQRGIIDLVFGAIGL